MPTSIQDYLRVRADIPDEQVVASRPVLQRLFSSTLRTGAVAVAMGSLFLSSPKAHADISSNEFVASTAPVAPRVNQAALLKYATDEWTRAIAPRTSTFTNPGDFIYGDSSGGAKLMETGKLKDGRSAVHLRVFGAGENNYRDIYAAKGDKLALPCQGGVSLVSISAISDDGLSATKSAVVPSDATIAQETGLPKSLIEKSRTSFWKIANSGTITGESRAVLDNNGFAAVEYAGTNGERMAAVNKSGHVFSVAVGNRTPSDVYLSLKDGATQEPVQSVAVASAPQKHIVHYYTPGTTPRSYYPSSQVGSSTASGVTQNLVSSIVSAGVAMLPSGGSLLSGVGGLNTTVGPAHGIPGAFQVGPR
jgi:hypothetical protein